jgi:hypothetical protein
MVLPPSPEGQPLLVALLLDQDVNWSPGFRMVCAGPFALVEKPSDDKTPQFIDCYFVEAAPPTSNVPGGAHQPGPR